MRQRRSFPLLIAALVVGLLLIVIGTNFYLDLLWFRELGFEGVFWTQRVARWGLRGVAFLFLFAVLFGNLMLARKALLRFPNLQLREHLLASGLMRLLTPRRLTFIFLALAAVFAALFTSYVPEYWIEMLRFRHGVPFDLADPIFGMDVSFYVFRLPFYRFLYGFLTLALMASLIPVGLIYLLVNPPAQVGRKWFLFPGTGLTHITLLLAGLVALKAWDYRLQQLELVLSERGVVFGAGYTDIKANLPALKVLMVLALLIAILYLINAFFLKQPRVLAYGLLVLIGVSMLGGWAFPAAVQSFMVEPSEFAHEKEYLEHSIKFTRQAFGLDRFNSRLYTAAETLGWDKLQNNPGTLNNVRLWDYRPLSNTLNQLQAIRLYYRFHDVDIDRYTVDDQYRQVMLAAREMDRSRFEDRAQTWVNMRLQYTHGYGAAVSPVNEVSSEGLPRYFVRDIPPVSSPGLELTEPSIYYGELTGDYVIVRSKTPEFHYATAGDENIYTTYEGEGGIPLRNLWRRLLFALKFGEYRILVSNELTAESRVMFDRDIHTRVRKVAPFLAYDDDPYLVIHDGRLFWIQDAYTATRNFPYSTVYGGVNYIRNSIKIVVDAYHGTVHFYLMDPTDPLALTFSQIFPDLFRPATEMPEGLVAHLRYPEDLFELQARALALYHTTHPNVVYSREDLWEVPVEIYGGREQPLEPYYTVLQLPGYAEEEFVLILPFTPARRDNMIAWMVARCDPACYGQVEIFLFPKDRVILGPKQIENRIDQDTEISEQLTLWGQYGSQVIRGNLLVLPIEDALLYVEPIFLEATGGGLPELARVIVVYQETVVMERNLQQALERIFGQPEDSAPVPAPPEEEPGPPPEEEPGPDDESQLPVDQTVAELAHRAQEVFDQAQQCLQAGDWAGYGAKLEELEQILEELARLTR